MEVLLQGLFWYQGYECSPRLHSGGDIPNQDDKNIWQKIKVTHLYRFSTQVRGITNREAGLQNLHGIEHLTNLRTLGVARNKLLSFKGIERLDKLESINACNNNLKTLSHLKGLNSLRTVYVNHNWGICHMEVVEMLNLGIDIKR